MAGITFPTTIDLWALDQYIRERTKPIGQKSPFWAKFKSEGRIKTNDKGGKTVKWPVTYKRQEPTAVTGSIMRTSFPQINFELPCELGWAAWEMGASIDWLTKLFSQHDETVWINTVQKRVDKMTEDFMAYLQQVPFLDGNASGAAGFMGIESFMGTTGSVYDTGSFALAPHDTYAGLDTDLGTYVNDWSLYSDNSSADDCWPDGTGDSGFCFFSPIVHDAAYTGWAATTHTWAGQWQYCLNAVQTAVEGLQSESIGTFIMTPKMFREACSSLIGVQQLQVTDPNSSLVKLGHKVKSYNGTELTMDAKCPAGCCYGINWQQVDIRTPQPQLLSYDKDFDLESSVDRHKQVTVLQSVWKSPAYFTKVTS